MSIDAAFLRSAACALIPRRLPTEQDPEMRMPFNLGLEFLQDRFDVPAVERLNSALNFSRSPATWPAQ
jgi:hypothetical protein